jgi:adenosylhomocysteine nucleosidase
VTATRIEFQAVARALQSPHPVSHYGYRALESHDQALNVLLIQSGIGPDKARKGTQQLLAGASWDVIISTGFAGALDAVPIGSVLIGHEVLSESSTTSPVPSTPQPVVCHPDWVQTALGIKWMGQESLRSGRFVSVGHVLTHSVDKHQLRADTGAVGVDMESAAIGKMAQGHGRPFLIIRAISDGVNEDLPVDFNLFLRPSGWIPGVLHIMTTPSSWNGFFDLYRHSKYASQQLTGFFKEFFFAVSTMSTSPTP